MPAERWWRGWRWWPCIAASAISSWPERRGSWSWLLGRHELLTIEDFSLGVPGAAPAIITVLTFVWTNRGRLLRRREAERVDDIGGQAAVEHLASLVRQWADSTGVVDVVRASPTNLHGVTCTLELSGGGKVRFDFLFTTGVESGEADDAIVEDLGEAWAGGWLDASEIWVSGKLDESSTLGRRRGDPPTSGSGVVPDAN